MAKAETFRTKDIWDVSKLMNTLSIGLSVYSFFPSAMAVITFLSICGILVITNEKVKSTLKQDRRSLLYHLNEIFSHNSLKHNHQSMVGIEKEKWEVTLQLSKQV